jgi:hypothetical protein
VGPQVSQLPRRQRPRQLHHVSEHIVHRSPVPIAKLVQRPKIRPRASRQIAKRQIFPVSLAKTRAVLSFTPLTMLQASAQTVDFKVRRHFGEGGIIGGPRETPPWWNCDPASQTERARTVTLHLPGWRARALSQPRGNGEQQLGGTYGVWRLPSTQPGIRPSSRLQGFGSGQVVIVHWFDPHRPYQKSC